MSKKKYAGGKRITQLSDKAKSQIEFCCCTKSLVKREPFASLFADGRA